MPTGQGWLKRGFVQSVETLSRFLQSFLHPSSEPAKSEKWQYFKGGVIPQLCHPSGKPTEGENCTENCRRQAQTFALSLPPRDGGVEVFQRAQGANPLSSVISQACALTVCTQGTRREVWPWESCACGLEPRQPRRRMEAASVLDRHTKCLLCSCAVSLACSLLAHPTCLFSLFFPFPQLNWRRGGCSSFLSLQLSCLADAVPWTQMSA